MSFNLIRNSSGKSSNNDPNSPANNGAMDLWLAGTAFVLLIIGLVMVYSASAPTALRHFGDATHFAMRNSIFALIGIVSMIIISRLPIVTIRMLAQIGFWLTIVLLIAVLIPGMGLEGGGARRWLNLRVITVQPSEPYKVMLALYLSHLIAQDPGLVYRVRDGIFYLLALFMLGAALLMLEPDFGATVISASIVFGIVFIAGIPLSWIAGLLMIAIPMAAVAVIMAPYRFRRVTSFLDPWDDPQNSSFQLVQSLLSFGNGGLLGTGLGQGEQKQFYLPESHTDFIFAVIGEEMGLGMVWLIIFLFAVLIWRAIRIARLCSDPFVRLSTTGLTVLIGAQAVANMGVVMGLLPPKGLTLPLVSYGGTSLIITLSAIGLLLAFSRTITLPEKPVNRTTVPRESTP
ncbi:putative lipid II flippase FtsW [Candidatus Magnetaquicoccus inordinatus]|uniref:putative lipid II flippase FtsW n=1 Tax=Candidatus Magnetaquicoccus inordinatus TaxID=2496818 RepID=UPI00187D5FD4|nr:putative lipid II flippase FtsW [Candidatus Magnetaquicoccus inordinatus]